jgi:hypothetical protein
VKAKARNEIIAETLHRDPLSPRPHTQVRSGSKLVPDMFPGKAHDVELFGKRVEMRLEICGFNTSQGREASRNTGETKCLLREPSFSTASGGVYDYADLRSPGSFTKELSLLTGAEPSLRDSAYS